MIKCLSGFVTSLDSILMRSESTRSWQEIRKQIIKKAFYVANAGGVERSSVSEGRDGGIASFPRAPVSGPRSTRGGESNGVSCFARHAAAEDSRTQAAAGHPGLMSNETSVHTREQNGRRLFCPT